MTLATLKIEQTCMDRDYHGCGRAWAAVVGGQVVAIRYMGDHVADDTALPAWVRAVRDNAEGLDSHLLPTAWSSNGLSKLAGAAEAAGDCPRTPRGKRYRPKELLTMARAALAAVDTSSFASHRERSRAELAQIGEVVSGMCSCCEFVPRQPGCGF